MSRFVACGFWSFKLPRRVWNVAGSSDRVAQLATLSVRSSSLWSPYVCGFFLKDLKAVSSRFRLLSYLPLFYLQRKLTGYGLHGKLIPTGKCSPLKVWRKDKWDFRFERVVQCVMNSSANKFCWTMYGPRRYCNAHICSQRCDERGKGSDSCKNVI